MTPRTLAALTLLMFVACADEPAPPASTAEMSEVTMMLVDTAESADAAEVVPPTAVEAAFAATRPSASGVAWTTEADGYEVSFREGGVGMVIVYAADGTPGAVETEIPIDDLPPAVAAALARDHAGHPVTEVARTVANGVTTYEAEVPIDGAATDLIYASDGTLLETVTVEDH